MKLAFVTGAIAAGVVGAVLAVALVWIITVVAGSADAWGMAPAAVVLAAIILGAATYVAERAAYRGEMARKRATGEPWAYRD